MIRKRIKIHSANANFQKIEVLKRNRKKRFQRKEFLVEGVRMLNAAKAAGWKFNALCHAEDRALSPWAHSFLEETQIETEFILAPNLMADLSEKEKSSELVAILEMPEDSFERIKLHPNLRFLIFDRPSKAGNLGTAIRSCNAFGVDAVFVLGHAVDIYDGEVLRSSVGTLFHTPVIRVGSGSDLMNWLTGQAGELSNFRLIGTSANADESLYKFEHQGALGLILGNETNGMSTYWSEVADSTVSIPMKGQASSLNVSAALSIILYELGRET